METLLLQDTTYQHVPQVCLAHPHHLNILTNSLVSFSRNNDEVHAYVISRL